MPRRQRILVVEDDPVVLEQLSGALEDEGYDVIRAKTAEEAANLIVSSDPTVVITDLRLPGSNGLDVVRASRQKAPQAPVLVVTAHGSVDTAVDAMRLGAFHYLQKPLSLDQILMEVEKALEHGQVLREREALRERLSTEQGLGRIIGECSPVVAMRDMIRDVARTDSTVLITGETGTGKELVANALHFESARASGAFGKVNCAAISETLLESELFGHEKGAFTGADRRRQGRFERADNGTLFLDEISEMGAHVQAKLLRILQGDPFERVGGDDPIHVDVRVISATNRNPEEAVKEGRLRADLFYRLNIVQIAVPPLRERKDDLPLLIEKFVSAYSAKHGKVVHGVTDKAAEVLLGYDWPGNVRQLENSIERAVVLTHANVLDVSDLPHPLNGGASFTSGTSSSMDTLNLQEVERKTLLKALEESGWNKAHAADKLGIFPSSLYKKMKRLDIPQRRPG